MDCYLDVHNPAAAAQASVGTLIQRIFEGADTQFDFLGMVFQEKQTQSFIADFFTQRYSSQQILRSGYRLHPLEEYIEPYVQACEKLTPFVNGTFSTWHDEPSVTTAFRKNFPSVDAAVEAFMGVYKASQFLVSILSVRDRNLSEQVNKSIHTMNLLELYVQAELKRIFQPLYQPS